MKANRRNMFKRRSNTRDYTDNRVCYYCRSEGHVIQKCHVKERDDAEKLIRQAMNEGTNQSGLDYDYTEEYIVFGSEYGAWEDLWYVNTTLKNHYTGSLKFFNKIRNSYGVETRLKNQILFIRGVGEIVLKLDKDVIIQSVFYSPGLHKNMLSLNQLRQKGFIVTLDGYKCKIEPMFKPKKRELLVDDEMVIKPENKEEEFKKILGDDKEFQEHKEDYLNSFFEEFSLHQTDEYNLVKREVSNMVFEHWSDCMRLLDLMDRLNKDWMYRDLLKGLFDEMVNWFINHYLRIPNMPMPPRLENGKEILLYDLYAIVRKEGGHKRVSQYNMWIIIAKDLGLDYSDGDNIRILYAMYLDVLEWNYKVKCVMRKAKTEQGTSINQAADVEAATNMIRSSILKEMDNIGIGSSEDYALFMDGDWNAAKRLFKRRRYDFTAACKALEEANMSLPKAEHDV